MPKRSPAKPIDWNADLLSRKRPAAAPVPVQAAPAAAAAPTGAPAWKQLLDNAVKDTPADTEATKVFDPAPEARPAVPQQPAAPPRQGTFPLWRRRSQAGHQRGGTDGPRAVRF